jgi:PAS domain S-box-containing protein
MRAGIIVFGCAVMALFLGLLASEILREYERSLERATANSQNLAAALEHHTTQTIEIVDDGLGHLIDYMDAIRGSPRLDPKLRSMLRRSVMDMSFVHRIVVTDETGDILQDSLEDPGPPANLAAESSFTVPRDYASAGIYISAPFKNRDNGRWSIAMSRRLEATAREFAGVIVAFVDLGYFQRIYDTLNIGEYGLIQLFKRDGTTLIREPFRADLYEQDPADLAAFRSLMQWTRNGTTTIALPPDGIERIISYRTVPRRPLVVAVGLSRAEALAQWRGDVRMRVMLAFIIIAAVALLMLLSLRSLARRDATESALRESQQRFELAVRGTSDGLWDWDMVADKVWFSPRCCELLGFKSVDEFSADYDDYFSRIHAEDSERRALALERHLKEGKPYDVEYRLRTKGGNYRWFRVRGHAIRDADGKPIRMAGSISDIDAHRAAEAALVETLEILRENEARLSSLIENVPGVIYRSVFDGRWTETFVNHALGELTGYPPTDFVAGGARGLSSIIHPEDRAFVEHTVAEAVRQRTPFAVEYRLIHKSGAVKWVWDRGRAIYAEDGQAQFIDGCIFDITDRREGEAELRRAKDTAEAANQAKSQFLAHMSHELRTPLNAIIGFSEVMQSELFGTMGSSQYRTYAQDIHESGTHLLGLINDILDLSKVEAGRQELHEEDCDIEEMVADTLRLVAERAMAQGVRIDRHLQAHLPALRADYRMIKQVLLNLLSNAVKFTPEDGTVKLSIGTTAEGGLRFVVQDNGIGIPSDQVRRVLEPFVQVEGAFTRKYGGTGLGLPLSRTFIGLHGGTLELSSAVGAGTTVVVTFPKERSQNRASAA